MSIQDLVDALNTVRDRIKKHGPKCSRNEMMTRYTLIDPLLRALDWDVSDPAYVVPEDVGLGGTTDYTMGRNSMLIEAKKFNERLDKHAKRLVDYIKAKNVRYGVLTNGGKWRMYDSKETTRTPVVEFDVNDPDGIIIPKAVRLYRSVVYAGLPEQQAGPKLGPEEKEDHGTEERILRIVSLPEIDFQKEREPPTQVSWSGTTQGGLKSWVDVLVCVAQCLIVYKGKLTKARCPVMSGSKIAILNTSPTNPDGTEFRESEEVGVLFLNKHGSKETVIRNASKLVKAAGLDAGFFAVGFPKRDD